MLGLLTTNRDHGGDCRLKVNEGKRDPRTCGHEDPALVTPAGGGLAATCLLCDTVGPERETAEEARRALLDLAGGRREE